MSVSKIKELFEALPKSEKMQLVNYFNSFSGTGTQTHYLISEYSTTEFNKQLKYAYETGYHPNGGVSVCKSQINNHVYTCFSVIVSKQIS